MAKPHYKVLIVDDSPADRALCRRYLQRDPDRDYTIWEEELSRQGLVTCQLVQPDCILLGYRFPDLDGLEFLSQLQVLAGDKTPAVVMFTGTGNESVAIEAMKRGVQDYLIKGALTKESLWRAVGNAIESVKLRRTVEVRHQQLRESEARFQAVVNTVPALIWEAAPDGTMTLVSEQWEAYCGMTAEQLVRDWPRLVLHPDDYERCVREWNRVLSSGTPYEIEVRNRRYDGVYRWFLTRAVPARDDTGRIIRWYGTTTDIQRHKQAEEGNLRLAAIVESSDDAIVGKSLEGIVTSWNAAAERIFGYRAEEMIGQPILRLLPEDRQDEEYMILARLRRGERVDHFETVRRTKDGRLLNVSLTISPIRNQYGTIIGASKIARDITARKHAEETQARLLAEVQRANAELQQFARIVSHDLNEPLRTISNFLELLTRRTKDTLPAEAEEYVALAVDGARRMHQMIADLLTYSRAGGRDLAFAPVDCEVLLASVLNDLQIAVTESGGTITHDQLPTVTGDATALGLVLQNLIGNALKFRSETPPRVHLSARPENQHWQFSVRDNGIGIDPTQAERIFQVFQRLHPRSAYQGSGIGLAICKRIVERHGGRIWVESAPGQGSTFFFTLPG